MKNSERRRHPRRSVRLDCTWDGASGRTAIRIIDLSLGGCYIDSRATPGEGTTLALHVTLAGVPLTLPGRVAFMQAGLGFGFEFIGLEATAQQHLAQFLGPSA